MQFSLNVPGQREISFVVKPQEIFLIVLFCLLPLLLDCPEDWQHRTPSSKRKGGMDGTTVQVDRIVHWWSKGLPGSACRRGRYRRCLSFDSRGNGHILTLVIKTVLTRRMKQWKNNEFSIGGGMWMTAKAHFGRIPLVKNVVSSWPPLERRGNLRGWFSTFKALLVFLWLPN